MSYLDKNLMNGEKIVYRMKPHWIIYFVTFLWLILSLFLLLYAPKTSIGSITLIKHYSIATLAGFFTLLMALYNGLSSYIIYVCSDYIVTNKRVLMRTGFVKRVSLDILLQRIESLQVSQPLPGRFMNYGAITISGTGGSRDPFYNIPSPYIFREKVQEQIESTVIKGN